jgi:YbgC/YbaW family acyl-CoA thioester hydrolase
MSRFIHQHRVTWPEVDIAGVVYFVHFLSYCEAAEVAWVRSHGLEYGEMLEKFGICMPRVSIQCDYHAPARLDDLLSIELSLHRLGNTSFTLAFKIVSAPAGVAVAGGRFIIATVCRSTFEAIRVPDELRDMLEELKSESTG